MPLAITWTALGNAMLKTLKDTIISEIALNGPMDVGRYMNLCLCHPEYGYYMTRDPFGQHGDFTTAPEISQLFGETIAAWVVQTWDALGVGKEGRPERWTLLECGPGRVTLIADVLRMLQKLDALPECYAGCCPVLLEVSTTLKSVQAETLKGHAVSWVDSIDDIPQDQPVLMIANEFFDALPVRQMVHTSQGWQERKVTAKDGDLAWCETACALNEDDVIPDTVQAVPYGTVYEFSLPREESMSAVCDAIKARSGAALMLDYGELEHKAGKSLHAIYDHRHVDALADPGGADLSANVDFGALEEVAKRNGLSVESMEQGAFLKAYGIEQRAQAVIAAADEEKRDQIEAEAEKALNRLVDSDQMGQRFKVMSIWGKSNREAQE
jgi:NADH dehydrogenase [ubiquinone] 1 alpha subcomplex assembly factor 7